MAKRNQIQIAIDALKKQLEKYTKEYHKADEAVKVAQDTKNFFSEEMKSLLVKINSLEGTNSGPGQ